MVLTAILVWILPITIGLYLSACIWSRTKDWAVLKSAPIRALPIALTVTPGYVEGFVPMPASVFLLAGWMPSDSSLSEALSASLAPIGITWLLLVLAILLVRSKTGQRRRHG